MHVDDDDDIRAIAQIALEVVGGLTLAQCASGAEALDIVEDFAPDLFLLDVMMPGMTGEETLAALRELPGMGSVPVVFMTAKAQVNDVEHLMTLGTAKVIAKPFDPLTLAAEIETILAESTAP
ncbi:Response regulator receiver domain-containing protein [Vannielia litorea]|uniref:Response regulator receiver domain-containing protein n=1 Tax=Vannielia litorea TaxID=1217970 RepID=A0A1N6EM56_9RHOB|nr:Response regulator receiver domain-containing protein [Vannielia litorea]